MPNWRDFFAFCTVSLKTALSRDDPRAVPPIIAILALPTCRFCVLLSRVPAGRSWRFSPTPRPTAHSTVMQVSGLVPP